MKKRLICQNVYNIVFKKFLKVELLTGYILKKKYMCLQRNSILKLSDETIYLIF